MAKMPPVRATVRQMDIPQASKSAPLNVTRGAGALTPLMMRDLSGRFDFMTQY